MPDLYHLPSERPLPAQRYVAARRQLSEVPTMRPLPFLGRWRSTLAAMGLGLGLSVGGGVALATGVFSHGQQPGAPSDTQLGHVVTVSRTGTATIDLGPVPPNASDISLRLTGLGVGTYWFPDGSSLGCSPNDLSFQPYGCQGIEVVPVHPSKHPSVRCPPGDQSSSVSGCHAVEVVPFHPKQHTVTITTSGQVTWRLSATYINRVITPWKTNGHGETYGVPDVNGFPDLIAVVFDDGRNQGYVKSTDLNCAQSGGTPPSSPDQALARQKALAGRSIAVAVYKSNGTTKIGTFYVGIGPHADAIPLSSLSCSGVGPVPFAGPSNQPGPAGQP